MIEILEGLTAGAAWSDLKLGFSRWKQISRMAVITDAVWVRDNVRLFAPIFHHPVRTFAHADLKLAANWIVANSTSKRYV